MKLFATNKSRILVFNTFFTKNKLKHTFLKEKLEISGFFSNVKYRGTRQRVRKYKVILLSPSKPKMLLFNTL